MALLCVQRNVILLMWFLSQCNDLKENKAHVPSFFIVFVLLFAASLLFWFLCIAGLSFSSLSLPPPPSLTPPPSFCFFLNVGWHYVSWQLAKPSDKIQSSKLTFPYNQWSSLWFTSSFFISHPRFRLHCTKLSLALILVPVTLFVLSDKLSGVCSQIQHPICSNTNSWKWVMIMWCLLIFVFTFFEFTLGQCE